MSSGKSPLLVPAIFWIIGLILARIFSPNLQLIILIFPIISSGWILSKSKLIILLLISLLGILHYQCHQYQPAHHSSHFFKSRSEIVQTISGVICSEVTVYNKNSYFELELESIADLPVRGKIRFKAINPGLKYGDRLNTTAILTSIKGSSNPYAFDYKEYLSFKQIYAQGTAKKSVKVSGNVPNLFKQIPIVIRKFIRNRIIERFPEKQVGFIKAIVIGDRSDLEGIRTTLTKAGLSHILAVSGLHVALIAVTLFTLLKIFIRHRILLRISAITCLIIYGAVCNWSPSVSRAVIMISLYFLGQIIQRPVNPLNILASSLIIITAISPTQLFSVGLQLSFCAVLVLLLVIPRISGFIYRIPVKIKFLRKIILAISSLMLISFILCLFLAPVTLYYFNQFNLNGVIGNILGIPLISFILPLSILLIFLPPVPYLVEIYRSSLEIIQQLFNWWSRSASELPFHFTFIPFSRLQVAATFLLLLTLISIITTYNKRKIVLLLILLVIIASPWVGQVNRNLKVIFFNCGLGDLCYIQTPEKENIMIDCGPTARDPDAFSRSALPYFRNLGIKNLDWLIITHAHNDHYGGLTDVLENLEVKNLLVTDEFQTRKIWTQIEDQISQAGAKIITVADTGHIPLEEVNFRIIHPDKNYTDDNKNNMSIVARLDHQELSILFNGDLELEGEEYLINRYPHLLDCDVTKVGHHGSKTSSSPDYIEIVSPQIAVISTSLKNRFDFPHAVTLEKYSNLKEDLIITGRDGAFIIESDGKNIKFQKYNQ